MIIGIPIYEKVDLLEVAAPYEIFNWMKQFAPALKVEVYFAIRGWRSHVLQRSRTPFFSQALAAGSSGGLLLSTSSVPRSIVNRTIRKGGRQHNAISTAGGLNEASKSAGQTRSLRFGSESFRAIIEGPPVSERTI